MRWILGAAGGITVILAAIAAVWKSVTWVHGRMRKIFRLVDDLAGEEPRPGFPGRPGLLTRVSSIETLQRAHGERLERGDSGFDEVRERLQRIEAELHPNGGGSLRDQVDRVARATGADTK